MSTPKDSSLQKSVGDFRPGDAAKNTPTVIKANDLATFTNFAETLENNPYETYNSGQNWYKALPYGFRFRPRGSTSESNPFTFYLPISPSEITTVTHFATNIIPTLYGTVEEHSEQRYYDITIAGTTGIAPRYYTANPSADEISSGRASQGLGILGNIGPQLAGGFFAKTLGQVNNIANKVIDTAASIIPGIKTETPGVELEKTGYMAFHRFYKFLLAYKRDTAGITQKGNYIVHPLQFINYKDNCQYDCAIQRFSLRRSAKDPLLYEYSINLRAYNLSPLTGKLLLNPIPDRLEALGLSGKSSGAFSKMKGVISGAKSIVGSIFSAGSGAGLKGLSNKVGR